MGVLNVTPDSLSDGGLYDRTAAAVAHGELMWESGADCVDVGGESTRPGAERVAISDELRRVVPVVERLSAAGVLVSIDTTRAAVAEAAVTAGAVLVNDVSGGMADPDMARVVADCRVPWVLNHSRGPSRDMYSAAIYRDVVCEVGRELQIRVDLAVAAGVDPDRIILDPGLGFAKRPEHNWSVLARLDELVQLGLPILVGSSRKSFLTGVLAGHRADGPAHLRDAATLATTVLAAQAGVWGVRVHDVAASADAVRALVRVDSARRTNVAAAA